MPGCRTFSAKTRNALGKLEGVSHLCQQDAADQTAQAGKHTFPSFSAPHLLSYPDLQMQPRSKVLSFLMFQLSLRTSLSQMCTGHLLRPMAFTCYLGCSQALSYLTRPGTRPTGRGWLLYWSCPRPGCSHGEPRSSPSSVPALGLGSSLHLWTTGSGPCPFAAPVAFQALCSWSHPLYVCLSAPGFSL